MKATGIEIDGKMYNPVRSSGFNPRNGYCGGCYFDKIKCKDCMNFCGVFEYGKDRTVILKERRRKPCIKLIKTDEEDGGES